MPEQADQPQGERGLQQNEDRLRGFGDRAPAMLWSSDAAGSLQFVSQAWTDYTGQSQEAALGFGWLEAVHPEHREEARSVLTEASRNQEAFTLDYRLRRATGVFRWAMMSGQPRLTPEREFAGFTGFVIDVHERKQESQASALLSAIVDSSDDAIVSKDLNGIIMSWNKAAERLFGYTAEEAIGQPITIIIPADRLDEEPKILQRLRRGERVDHFETIRVPKNGSPLNISLTISPVRDAGGRIIGASKIARDITDRVRREEALRRANADLQQFGYSVSHDLQEPLRTVVAYTELLQRKFGGVLGTAGMEYIHQAVQAASRMERLLEDLRNYLQVSTGSEDSSEEADAGEVLQKTISNLQRAVQESRASITSSALPRIAMPAFQLEQLLQNLIANAIRYRSEAPPRIEIAATLKGPYWEFSIRDNGIGIAPEYKEQVFGIFKRLHSAADYPGTGMGLAICKRIVERRGGRIWVESAPGQGSTFYFTVWGRNAPARAAPEEVFDCSGRR
jgi:PAS domain S-box-containing protein